MVQESELNIAGVFVLVMSYQFQDLVFQAIKREMELGLMVCIAGLHS